ncbi:hypothetical protein P3T37_000077 [Kitasatospora sp. MAA4]|uniref:ML domain-containing protein n=1 Tax=Kitasatospora sp. MAA4 TaxID=3035093 RepID=UPI002474A116|nr:ML domain-containing protein [Kitasatospora sp. MAA4]MDH6130710.1 hypothetical protein [Kitasatospora sp. MAA4]
MAGWSYTDAGLPSDPLQIESLLVSPDPPKPGSTVTLRINAVAVEAIEDGAYFDLVIKLGLVKLLQRRYDLFEELRGGGVDALKLSCDTSDGKGPIPKGRTVLTAVIDLPREIPRAKFMLNVRAFTVNDDDLAALDIKVDFQS